MSGTTGVRLRRQQVAANGLSFECLRAGDGDRLALCLHGFPDNAGSMIPLMQPLVDAEFSVVAPFMRGYAPTDPAPDGRYSAGALGHDAIALADVLQSELGTDETVLIGHDWGAIAAYTADLIDPNAFSKLVAMAVPPALDALVFDHPRQMRRSWYLWFFQLPVLPERVLRARNFELIECLWRSWSPGWEYPDARIRDVKETFRAGNTVEHAVQYYRDTVGGPVSMLRDGRPSFEETAPIKTPTLVIYGEQDGCIGQGLFARTREVIEECRTASIPDAGHFMHQERPGAVGEAITAFV